MILKKICETEMGRNRSVCANGEDIRVPPAAAASSSRAPVNCGCPRLTSFPDPSLTFTLTAGRREKNRVGVCRARILALWLQLRSQGQG